LNSRLHGQNIQIIRAFSYFSQLANIADAGRFGSARRHHGSCACSRRDAAISRSNLQNFFTDAIVCPVLTAHPTEVRRKSTIDREMEVAHLLEERDRLRRPVRPI
jgi:phosphoenolpyruvate carboxylase